VLGGAPFHSAAQGQVEAVVRHDTVRFVGGLALRSMAGAALAGVTADGGELHLDLGARRTWDLVELGAHVRGRATHITVSSVNASVRDGTRTYWDYGLGVSGLVWPWRGERFALGVVIQTTLWARPHLISVEGQELLKQARFDVFAGPVLELRL
jgi:hypothetical protein